MAKNLLSAEFGPFGPNLRRQKKKKNLLKNLAPSVTRYYGHLSSCTISEKTNDPILRELKDGRTDGQTDNFIGYCLTVECPIKCP